MYQKSSSSSPKNKQELIETEVNPRWNRNTSNIDGRDQGSGKEEVKEIAEEAKKFHDFTKALRLHLNGFACPSVLLVLPIGQKCATEGPPQTFLSKPGVTEGLFKERNSPLKVSTGRETPTASCRTSGNGSMQ